jgi:hypothetical protein
MRILKMYLSLALAILFFGCGGSGGGGGSSSGGGSSLSCENNGIPKFTIAGDSTAKAGQPFTETYSWCDSEADISELWFKITSRGISAQDKVNAADYKITGASGTQQNTYNWPAGPTGDFFIDFWVKDAKGNTSNVTSIKVVVSTKEQGQLKTYPSSGGGIIDKALRQIR